MKILALLGCLLAIAATAFSAAPKSAPLSPAERSLKICLAADAPVEVHRAAEAVLTSAKTHPLLHILAGEHVPETLTESRALLAAPSEARAFDHLVLIGLSSDPLIEAAWQREARVSADGGMYIAGFGHLRGDIGYIESDRNPFLHSRAIARAPFETEVVTLTGSTPAGVALAVHAFLKQNLVNGVVAGAGWTRPKPNLLQRDPLPADFVAPKNLPEKSGEWTRLGVTQAGEDEYRGILADTGIEPREIWRAKYFRPGVWDGAGAASAFANYSAGLHRRATGNTMWVARFASEAEAQSAVPKIATAAKLKKEGAVWKGVQPPFSTEKESPGPLRLWQSGEWIFMSTLQW